MITNHFYMCSVSIFNTQRLLVSFIWVFINQCRGEKKNFTQLIHSILLLVYINIIATCNVCPYRTTLSASNDIKCLWLSILMQKKAENPLTHSHGVRQARTAHYTGHCGILGQQVGFHAEKEKNILQLMNSNPA